MVSSELGELDEGKVNQTFESLTSSLGDCLQKGAGHVEFIGGHVKFFVRIGADGSAKWAYLSESTIGDRATERCMLDAAKGAHWPAPAGGEGQAQKAFDFDPSPDVRAPVPWASDRAAAPVAHARAKLAHCNAHGRFRATAYVQTDGSVLSAGVAPPDDRAEQASDCVVGIVKGLKFTSPGSWPAKISFDVE
jgi:hypothetical protein